MNSISEMPAAIRKAEPERSGVPSKAFAKSSFLESLQVVGGGRITALSGMPFYRADHLPKGVLCLLMSADGKPVGMIVDETYEPPPANSAHSDAGGSAEAMQELVEARDKLRGAA